MPDLGLVVNLVLAVLAALAGGVVAQRLGQPVILGYLLGGFLIGPSTPGPVVDHHSVEVLAEIGIIFLMFALGAEISLAELRRMGRVAGIGGGLQIVATMALGVLLAPLLGLTPGQGIFLGALLALSSTVVALKVLMARGELDAPHGRVTLGILIAQDLAVVPMVVILPAVAGGGEGLLQITGIAVLKALALMAGAYVVGTRAVPLVLQHVATGRSRELFLLTVVGLSLGTALISQLAGLSLAFGAFLAGLVVSESEYRAQVVAEVLPMRDLFASLFFVSVGMLIDPGTFVSQLGLVAILTIAILAGKMLIATGAGLIAGVPGSTALIAGLSLAQVGEFSFVLAGVGVEAGAIPASVLDLILATALVTIIVSPFAVRMGAPAAALARKTPGLRRLFADRLEAHGIAGTLRQHTVICGFGRVGQELVEALETRGMRYLVIDYNPVIVRQLRSRGVPVIYGDASSPAVLEHAHLERAKLLAVLMPDADAAQVVTHHARQAFPRLDIVVRARSAADLDRLRRAGATDVVQPEFEAGVEVIRHALRRYGIGGPELSQAIAGRRATFYRHAESALHQRRGEDVRMM